MADFAGHLLGSTQLGMPMSTPAFANHTVDANTEGVAFAFQALNANAITGFGFRYGARTGTPPTFVATIESLVATTGLPDGADIGGGSPTAVTFTPPADATWDGTWRTVTFTNAYTPSRGQYLVVTIRYSSGTIDGSNNSSFTTEITNMLGGSSQISFPYALRNTGGTWAKRTLMPVYSIITASERYGNPMQSIYVTNSAGTNGHRHAMKFTLPTGSGSTFKVRGFRFVSSVAGGAGINAQIAGLWSASSTIQDVTFDSDIFQLPSGDYMINTILFDEASLTDLDFNTAYYVGLEVTGSSRVGMRGVVLASSADLAAYPGGSNFHFATYNGSAWSDDQTMRPWAELILDDQTCTGGGGVVFPPIMSGGGILAIFE